MTHLILKKLKQNISFSDCQTKDGRDCKLPFTYQNITHQTCLVDPIDPKETWCSTKIDSNGVHINGIGNYGFCSDDCVQCKNNNRSSSNDYFGCKSELILNTYTLQTFTVGLLFEHRIF